MSRVMRECSGDACRGASCRRFSDCCCCCWCAVTFRWQAAFHCHSRSRSIHSNSQHQVDAHALLIAMRFALPLLVSALSHDRYDDDDDDDSRRNCVSAIRSAKGTREESKEAKVKAKGRSKSKLSFGGWASEEECSRCGTGGGRERDRERSKGKLRSRIAQREGKERTMPLTTCSLILILLSLTCALLRWSTCRCGSERSSSAICSTLSDHVSDVAMSPRSSKCVMDGGSAAKTTSQGGVNESVSHRPSMLS